MWVSLLLMSEAWGVPPWEVEQRPGAMKWSRRYGMLQRARSERHDEIERELKRKHSRR